MAKQLQLRRGTTVQNDAFTGAIGELTMDTDKKQLRLHDGATQGGCGFIDPVVAFQIPTAENNYTWYRKYASGWVEQGGRQSAGSNAWTTVNLPVTMANKYYQIIMQANIPDSNDPLYSSERISTPNYPDDAGRTTTSFKFITHSVSAASTVATSWEVKGMAA